MICNPSPSIILSKDPLVDGILAAIGYNLLQTLSQFCGSPYPVTETDVRSIVGEEVARTQLTDIVSHAMNLRWGARLVPKDLARLLAKPE